MKTIITIECPSPEAAAALFARFMGAAEQATLDVQPIPLATALPLTPPPAAEKPARKPRSDKGQQREPYGPRTTEAKPGAAGAQVSDHGGAPAGSPSAAPGAASTTNDSAQAPAPQGNAAGTQQGSSPAAVSTDPDFPATLEGARKAMAALNATSGKGMDACIGQLKGHGVNRISDLPKEKYAAFIEAVLAECSKEGIEAAKKAPTAAKK